MTDPTAPQTAVEAAGETACEHRDITRWATADGAAVAWACADCRIRFYPACPECVDVGHRNVEHPVRAIRAESSAETERLRAELVESAWRGSCQDCLGNRFVNGHKREDHGQVVDLDSALEVIDALRAPADAAGGREVEG